MNLVPATLYLVRLNPLECVLALVRAFSCVKIDERKAREREIAKIHQSRRAEGMVNPVRDEYEGTYRGGKGRRLCLRLGLSRRSRRVKPRIHPS